MLAPLTNSTFNNNVIQQISAHSFLVRRFSSSTSENLVR